MNKSQYSLKLHAVIPLLHSFGVGIEKPIAKSQCSRIESSTKKKNSNWSTGALKLVVWVVENGCKICEVA